MGVAIVGLTACSLWAIFCYVWYLRDQNRQLRRSLAAIRGDDEEYYRLLD